MTDLEDRHPLHRVGGIPAAGIAALVDKALTAAAGQRITVPGQAVAADIVRELANETLKTRTRLSELDKQIEATLDQSPDAALIRSLPATGATVTAELPP